VVANRARTARIRKFFINYFLLIAAPQEGHLRLENLNPGLDGTSALHEGQVPAEFFWFRRTLAGSFGWPAPPWPGANSDLMGFFPFLCGMESPPEIWSG